MNTEPTTVELVAIATAISSAISVLLSIYLSWKKSKPEIKKLEREEESEIVDAAHTTIEGAMISSTMLKERIDELRRELDTEKQARRTDREYFKRRINELEKELRDYRSWAAQLAKQVIEAGKQPAAFVPNILDTDPSINIKPDTFKRE